MSAYSLVIYQRVFGHLSGELSTDRSAEEWEALGKEIDAVLGAPTLAAAASFIAGWREDQDEARYLAERLRSAAGLQDGEAA